MNVKQLEIRSSLFRKRDSLFPLGSAAFWGCTPKMDIGRKRDGTGGSIDLCARGGFLRGAELLATETATSTVLTGSQLCTWQQLQGRGGQGFVPGP